MRLGKSNKNTPGCLTNKAMAYIKSKPAMYGKPAKFEDQKGTSEGITKADVVSARTKGYNPKMYGDPVKKTAVGKAYDKLKEEGSIRTQGSAPRVSKSQMQREASADAKKEYDKQFGVGAAAKRKRKSDKAAALKALGSRPTRAQVEEFKRAFPKMYKKK